MDEILDLAGKLGQAIARDARYKAVVEMEKQIAKDEPTRTLLAEYTAQQRKIAELEENMKPIEPADKRRLQELHERVAGNALVKRFSMAQFEYASLMRQVDEAIQSELAPND